MDQERIAFGRQIYDYFVAKGLPPHQAAAVAGNMAWESAGRTNLVNRGDNFRNSPNAPHSVGIGQWNDRSQALFDFARQQGIDLPAGNMRDPRYVQAAINRIPLQAQLDFAWNEMQGPERRAYGNIANSPDLRGATANAMSYHRPAGWTWSNPAGGHGYGGRYQLASNILNYEGAPAQVVASVPNSVPPGYVSPITTTDIDPKQYLPQQRMALGAPIPRPDQRPAPAPMPDPVTSSPDMSPGPEPMVQPAAAPQPPGPDKWEAVKREAIYNSKVPPPMAPSVGPSPSFQQSPFDAGAFFKAFDGSGFKDGGAVKSSKPTAQYRGHPNRGDKCRDCTMFVAPHGCTAVRGAISPYGWCKYFEATPTAVAQAIKKAATQVERNPTELQKEWGNYSMGHFNWKGLEITLENPKGSIRRGKGWEVKMPAGYGYIKRTVGRDLDHVDVYVGDDHASDKVFVIDQVDAATGKFDEHKCMLSMPSKAVAVATYNKGFSDGKGPDRMGAVSELPVEKFKAWLEKGDTKKPMGKIVKRRAEGGRVQDLDALSKGLDPVPAGRRDDIYGPLKSENKSVYGAADEVRLALDLLQRRAHGLYPDTVPPVEEDTFRGQPGGRLLDSLEGIDRMGIYEPGGRMADYEIVPPVRRVFNNDGMGVRPDNQSDKVNPVVDASLDTARKYSRGR